MCSHWHGNPKPTVVVKVRQVRRELVLRSNIFPRILVHLSKEQRIFVLTSYFDNKSFKTVKQKFLQHFPNIPIPVSFTITQLLDKFKDTDIVADEQWSGRKKSTTTREYVDCVEAVVSQHPYTSSHRIVSTFQLMV